MATDAALTIDVVGIGADGWDGLAPSSARVIAAADVLFGSSRQLDAVPDEQFGGERITWPSPMIPALRSLLESRATVNRCVLASGDPMFHGIGTTLARLLGADNLRVFPHPSSASIVCARLGWALDDVDIVSLVARQPQTIVPAFADGRRLLILSEDDTTPATVAELLHRHGFGDSVLTVATQLGGPRETISSTPASDFTGPAADTLNIIAVQMISSTAKNRVGRTPGLPDKCFSGDGQLTKNEVRALTLSALAPSPGETLWDVGGGSGSIAIEWMRSHPRCRAHIFEQHAARRDTIVQNASALGVPSLSVHGAAPAAFAELTPPDAIFVGGGATESGLLDECWNRLPRGGRMVVNSVTAESEAVLLRWYSMHGGRLRKFQIYRGEPLGGFTAWRPQLPVAQWIAVRGDQ